MKTIRNQVKCPEGLQLQNLYRRAFRPVLIQFVMRLKRTTKRQQTKIQLELARKRCRRRKAIFCPKKYENHVQLSLLQTPIM